MSLSIAVTGPSPVPFQVGGAEKFLQGLHCALSTYADHKVELIKLPCRDETFADLVDSYRRYSELDLSHFDMVISSKYPSWMVQHPNHIVYMLHPMRILYDSYLFTGLPERLPRVPAPLRDLVGLIRREHPNRSDLQTAFELCDRALNTKSLASELFTLPGPLVRELVHFFDRIALASDQISTHMAISKTVRQRSDYFPSDAEVVILHPPSDITEYSQRPGEYIFTASRLTSLKRMHLVVTAMRYVQANIPLKIAGTGPELNYLKALAANDPRIEFLGYVPDAELPALYAGALFVPFVPYNEDYGLITIEAMHSGKPVITTHDAGGVCEFVEHGVTGLCVEPAPKALGRAMQQLAASPEITVQMGNNARQRVAHITWKNTVNELLSQNARSELRQKTDGRKTVVICSTYPAAADGHPGQQRLYHGSKALAEEFSVLLICIGTHSQQTLQLHELMPHVHELLIPWPDDVETKADQGNASLLLMQMHDYSPLHETLHRYAADAACIIASHPCFHTAISKALPHVPLIYDAYTVNADMKSLLQTEMPADMLHDLNILEQDCCHTAHAILTCSQSDARRLRHLYGIDPERCCLVPNGCDNGSVRFTDAVQRKALRQRLAYPDTRLALFMGNDNAPDVEAAAHILSMAAHVPDVQFLLAGTVSTHAYVQELPRPDNVHLVGTVSESVRNLLLQTADVGLNPLTSGADTNLRIIEYVMSGLETVSTLFGMRGLRGDFTPSVHVCALEDFPHQIRSILEKPSSVTDLESAAERTANRYAWSATMRPLCTLIRNFCDHSKDAIHATAH